jgi:protein SCO1/2
VSVRPRSATLLAVFALSGPAAAGGELPMIGAAPDFALTAQDGRPLALTDLRGKVVVVDFIFASCADSCPLQTARLAGLRHRLGKDFGPGVTFVSISVDPERDTPAVLRRYAAQHGAHDAGWAFLTGRPEAIRDIARNYGVIARRSGGGDVSHNAVTSLIDRGGTLRVQYLGVHYRPAEMLADIRSLLQERGRR